MKVIVSLLVILGLSFNASSMQLHPKKDGNNTSSSQDDGYNKANCPPSQGKLLMQFNDVKALIEVGGSMWQNRQINAASYEVPKGGGNHVLYSGSIWMAGLTVNNRLKIAAIKFRQGNDFWAGPLSVTPGTGNYDPSQPVGDNATRDFGAATIDPDVCIQYDKFFTIKKSEVINFTRIFQCNQDPTCNEDYPITNDAIQRIYNWPAHGDVSRGQDYYLAPFYDYPVGNTGTGDGVYNPDDGDIPWFDDILGRDDVKCGFDRRVTLFGDITHWWVFNDKGNIHTETNGKPIGMEIRAQAFSFATNDEVNQMTFYNYQMINRGTQTLYKTYFSQYADPDVGFSEDDYVGCDVSRGLGFAYNGVNHDPGQSGAPGYGDNPPAVGIDFFQGPYQDADGVDNPGPHRLSDGTMYTPSVQHAIDSNGIVYSGIGVGYSDGIIDNERYGMRIFDYYDRTDFATAAGITDDPSGPNDYYNYMTGHWKDNSPFYYGGKGYTGTNGVTTTEAAYAYPGSSDPYHWGTKGVDMGFDWSESNVSGSGTASNNPGDRRFLETAGPFTLKPGAINNLTVGVVFGQSFTGNAYASVDVMKKNDTKAQALFDNCFRILDPPQAPNLQVVELENKLVLLIDNPYGNNKDESYNEEDKINIQDPVNGPPYDKHYRFEGYQIFQLAGKDNGISDVTNFLKDGTSDFVRLVGQCDVKNNVAELVNFDYNEQLGYSVPHKMVSKSGNDGIQHSFEMTQDAFTGKALVNHKTYYYLAIAYAYNNYKTYNPNNPQMLDGQKHPYISSRLAIDGGAIHSVPAIPHSPQPRFGGTVVQLPYGSSPQISTLDGTGNGNLSIDLTQKSEDFILANDSIETPTYQVGKGPINIKVVDPLNVKGGYYRLLFTNASYDPKKVNTVDDSTTWKIERFDKKGGQLLGTVTSDRSIGSENEQLIPQWGISVNVFQDKYPCIVPDSTCFFRGRIAAPIESTLSFDDSSKIWLTGVQNVTSYQPENWISTGSNSPSTDSYDPTLGLQNPECYKLFQINHMFADQNNAYAGLLKGTATLGLLARRNDCGYSPIGLDPSLFGVIQEYSMSSILQPSVDIVFTNDKSKWTRCPVIELGHDPNLNINGGIPGQLRMSPSVDKNGKHVGDAGYNASEADPNGLTPYGMGWFPGYAIDEESGRRLNMAFGENSFLVGENGSDMIWNPTSNLSKNGLPVMGGQHIIYVFGRDGRTKGTPSYIDKFPAYDQGAYLYDLLKNATYLGLQNAYAGLSWVVNPLLVRGTKVLETGARIRLRINKEYAYQNRTGINNGYPAYEWNMSRYGTEKNNKKALTSALDIINVVPNPYYAFSEYETGRLDTRVKITNLPEKCKVTIYNTSGKLIRAYDKDSPITSIDWDLKNSQKIPVAGGVYLIHVEVPGIGSRVIKFFGGMRQPDLENL